MRKLLLLAAVVALFMGTLPFIMGGQNNTQAFIHNPPAEVADVAVLMNGQTNAVNTPVEYALTIWKAPAAPGSLVVENFADTMPIDLVVDAAPNHTEATADTVALILTMMKTSSTNRDDGNGVLMEEGADIGTMVMRDAGITEFLRGTQTLAMMFCNRTALFMKPPVLMNTGSAALACATATPYGITV